MKNVGQLIFEKQEGETQAAHEARTRETQKLFKRVFNNSDGKELLSLLCNASNPMGPRHGGELTQGETGFLDGEKSTIGFLVLNSFDDPLEVITNNNNGEENNT